MTVNDALHHFRHATRTQLHATHTFITVLTTFQVAAGLSRMRGICPSLFALVLCCFPVYLVASNAPPPAPPPIGTWGQVISSISFGLNIPYAEFIASAKTFVNGGLTSTQKCAWAGGEARQHAPLCPRTSSRPEAARSSGRAQRCQAKPRSVGAGEATAKHAWRAEGRDSMRRCARKRAAALRRVFLRRAQRRQA